MSHDKIKSATRDRMTVTGEPYAAAREVMREHRQASGRDPVPAGSMLLDQRPLRGGQDRRRV